MAYAINLLFFGVGYSYAIEEGLLDFQTVPTHVQEEPQETYQDLPTENNVQQVYVEPVNETPAPATVSICPPPGDDYIKFSSKDAFTLNTFNGKANWTAGHNLYYWDGINWVSWGNTASEPVVDPSVITSIQFPNTDTYCVYLKGDSGITNICTSDESSAWVLTSSSDTAIDSSTDTAVELSGNIETLRGAQGNSPSATQMVDYCYANMFKHCSALNNVCDCLMPAQTLSKYCYYQMFDGCGLASLPNGLLPANNLAQGCYQSMFDGCSKLQYVPTAFLPAKTLAKSCYQSMFSDCVLLENAPILPAEQLCNYCYRYMFKNCLNLDIYEDKWLGLISTEWKLPCYNNKAVLNPVDEMLFNTGGDNIITPANDEDEVVYYQGYNVYSISYKDQGNLPFSGRHVGNYPLCFRQNSVISLDKPTRYGYEFMGYYTDSQCSPGNEILSINEDHVDNLVVYAKWDPVLPAVPDNPVSTITAEQELTINTTELESINNFDEQKSSDNSKNVLSSIGLDSNMTLITSDASEPTGLMIENAPFLVLILVPVGLVVCLFINKRYKSNKSNNSNNSNNSKKSK